MEGRSISANASAAVVCSLISVACRALSGPHGWTTRNARDGISGRRPLASTLLAVPTMPDQWAVMLSEIQGRTERLRAMVETAQAIKLKLATVPPPRTAEKVKG